MKVTFVALGQEQLAISLLSAIAKREVNTLCERCPIADCLERAAPPTVLEKREKVKQVERVLGTLK